MIHRQTFSTQFNHVMLSYLLCDTTLNISEHHIPTILDECNIIGGKWACSVLKYRMSFETLYVNF